MHCKKNIFIICLLLLTTVSTELYFRIFWKDSLPERSPRPLIYQYDSVTNYRYLPNFSFALNGKIFHVNSLGYIGKELDEKSPKNYRIAIVGSSEVAGSVNLPRYTSFCDDLQQIFDDSGYRVEVVNCGIDGSNRSYELFLSVRQHVIQTKPDLILFLSDIPFNTNNIIRECYGDNIINYVRGDLQMKRDIQQKVDQLNRVRPFIDICYHSYIFRAICKGYIRNFHETNLGDLLWAYIFRIYWCRQDLESKLSIDETCLAIDELRTELTRENIKFFLFSIYDDQEQMELARQNKLPFLNLRMKMLPEDYFPEDIHLNESGCRKVAEKFYFMLTRYNIVDSTTYRHSRPY